MTCLYCGKKLGFFSRYKDTPFCSEEHLRLHQDEMERALMERLGSKITAQNSRSEVSLSAAPEDPEAKSPEPKKKAAAGKSSHFDAPLDMNPASAGSSTQAEPSSTGRGSRIFPDLDSARDLGPLPAAERPINKNSLLGLEPPPPPPPAPIRENSRDTARDRQTANDRQTERAARKREEPEDAMSPACEEFFEPETAPVSLLDTANPQIPASSFAIIIQADFCTPSLPKPKFDGQPAVVEEEFSLNAESVEPLQFSTEELLASVELPPTADAVESFSASPLLPAESKAAIPTISSLAGQPQVDIWDAVPILEDLLQLNLNLGQAEEPIETSSGEEQLKKPIGGRPEIPPRPRQRLPLASSVFLKNWGDGLGIAGAFPFTHADEWEGIEPLQSTTYGLSPASEKPGTIEPNLEVPLSLQALAQQAIAEDEDGPFEFDPQGQKPQVGLLATWQEPELHSAVWNNPPALPLSSGKLELRFRIPPSPKARTMQGINFPSLFHLNPVLPPKPEGGAYHA
jgi:hypothetical protein